MVAIAQWLVHWSVAPVTRVRIPLATQIIIYFKNMGAEKEQNILEEPKTGILNKKEADKTITRFNGEKIEEGKLVGREGSKQDFDKEKVIQRDLERRLEYVAYAIQDIVNETIEKFDEDSDSQKQQDIKELVQMEGTQVKKFGIIGHLISIYDAQNNRIGGILVFDDRADDIKKTFDQGKPITKLHLRAFYGEEDVAPYLLAHKSAFNSEEYLQKQASEDSLHSLVRAEMGIAIRSQVEEVINMRYKIIKQRIELLRDYKPKGDIYADATVFAKIIQHEPPGAKIAIPRVPLHESPWELYQYFVNFESSLENYSSDNVYTRELAEKVQDTIRANEKAKSQFKKEDIDIERNGNNKH